MEHGNAAYDCRKGNDLIAVFNNTSHQTDIFGIPLHKMIIGMLVITLLNLAILGIVINSKNNMPTIEYFFNQIPSNKTSRTGN